MGGDAQSFASSCPGLEPRWTSSAKSGVGTALTAASRVWFALSHRMVNEVYFSRIGQACNAELDVAGVAPGTNVVFTILWMTGQRRESTNYSVEVGLRSGA